MAEAKCKLGKGKKMTTKTPFLLDQYLETTEQDESKMSRAELLAEAEWVLWEALNTYPEAWDKPPHHMQVKALKRYIEKLKEGE